MNTAAVQERISEVAICRLAGAALASAFGVPERSIMSARRGSARAARARQAALYLAHIGFGLTYSTVGRAFGRDRTTVRHACARIEDAREDRGLDLGLGHLEQATLSLHSAIAAMTALDHGAISPTTPMPWRLA